SHLFWPSTVNRQPSTKLRFREADPITPCAVAGMDPDWLLLPASLQRADGDPLEARADLESHREPEHDGHPARAARVRRRRARLRVARAWAAGQQELSQLRRSRAALRRVECLRDAGVLGEGEAMVLSHRGLRGVSRLLDRKSTRLNSSHVKISYAVFCLKKK